MARLELAINPLKGLGWFKLGMERRRKDGQRVTQLYTMTWWMLKKAPPFGFAAALMSLGMSLWDAIRLIRDQATLIPVVDLKYCEEVCLLTRA